MLRKEYQKTLDELLQKPLKWDLYDDVNLPGLDWRLWNSVEILDITLSRVEELIEAAKKRRKTTHLHRLEAISTLIDEAIGFLDPWSWREPRKSFKRMTTKRSNLQKALMRLEEALEDYLQIYLDVSINLEAKRRGGWIVNTPHIVNELRNATYGLKQFIKQKEKGYLHKHNYCY